jgi:hypothetical protein
VPERIYKLQPNRTLQLRGFDDLGASAAIHAATASSFKVSGIFRDPADFAVLVLYDADNFYEHPRLKYLPDTNFDGLTLTFDVHYSGLMPLDSPKYATIDWPFLDLILPDSSTARIRMFDHAVQIGGTYTAASGQFVIQDNGLHEYDRITLWYQNLAFDYIAPKVSCSFAFYASGVGTAHSVTVAGSVYAYTEEADVSSTQVAQAVAAAAGASAFVSVATSANTVTLRAKKTDGSNFNLSSSADGATYTLYSIGAATIAANLASQINGLNWAGMGVILPLAAASDGATLTIATTRPGYDGNMIRMYAVWKNESLRAESGTVDFSGGSSDATWRIALDFRALGTPQIRQMWLTFAPPLAYGAAFQDTEWQATFTNWGMSGPESTKALQVAAPGSIRIEEDSPSCRYAGAWETEAGFYSGSFARRAKVVNDSVTVRYHCPITHDLWIGTSLYADRGVAGVRLDTDAETDLDCHLAVEPAVNTRRKVRSQVQGGAHTLTLRLKSGSYFYFDFMEAVIAGDVPDSLPARQRISPALDYSTDHSYKLPPARIHWMMDKLGFAGPMNTYIGVFWWNQRKRTGAVTPAGQIVFGGTFDTGDQIFVDIGGQTVGKTVFPNETNETFALHFASFINETYVGVWADASGATLHIAVRSPKPAYSYTLTAWKEPAIGSSGTVTTSGSLQNGQPGKWEVDPAQSPPLNRGAREWLADHFAEGQARGRQMMTSASMELVNPPAGYAAVYPDGQIVETSVGFGSLNSSHCALSANMLNLQKSVFKTIADLQAAAGLTPAIQFGEMLWWFFTNYSAANLNGGMAYYDDDTKAAAQAALGRPLAIFRAPTDDPAGPDALFLRNRLRDHAAAIAAYVRSFHSGTQVELLFPYDVNHPEPAGINNLGGKLNRYVNFPAEWESKATSPFDYLKMEALDFGARCRDLELAETAIVFPLKLGWPRDAVRYLVPVFTGGYPWDKEYMIAVRENVASVNLWAFDHVCIFGLPPGEPVSMRRAVMVR